MKIVNICMSAPFTEGYTYQDSMLSDYQQRLGHKVTVITGIKTRNDAGKIISTSPCETELSNGVHLIRLQAKGIGKFANNILGVYSEIEELLERLSPDFIMVHGLGTHVPAYAVSYKKKHSTVHLVADSHQDYGITNTRNIVLQILGKYFKIRWKSWIKSYDKIYAVTSWRMNFAHEQYGIPFDKLDVLMLGIGDECINSCYDNQNRRRVREKYGIPEEAFLFVSGGKLDEKKKILQMMRAFEGIELQNAWYLIFGSVSDEIKGDFEQILRNDNRIIYTGYIPSSETNNYLAASDFGLFAGNHSVLWEQAVGCGLPCLFKKYSDFDHVNADGNCVQLTDSSTQKIREIMEKVLQEPDYYFCMKQASKEAAKSFSYTEIAKKSLEHAEKTV